MPDTHPQPPLANDHLSLPAWIYHAPQFFHAEKARIFRPSWQIVCHLSDVPTPGAYHTLDFLDESLAVVRGADHRIRGFHNVCRHRAARLLDGPSGQCAGRITCPYHAWTYALDGKLVGVPDAGFAGLDRTRHGLAPVETEIYRGFIFVRLEPGGPAVADMMAEYDAELAPYRLEELQPLGRVTMRPRAVNWKNIGDNYSDALHITVAHPGLTNLFGRGYGLESGEWVDKMWGALIETPSKNRAERMYQKYLPDVEHLPPERKTLWSYYKLWPNIAFDIYPDQIDFMQSLPISPTHTIIREIAYAIPDSRREMRAARYLNWRINRQVSLEDKALIERVQQGMKSSSYTVGPLGEGEVSLRSFAKKLKKLIPEAALPNPPAHRWSDHS